MPFPIVVYLGPGSDKFVGNAERDFCFPGAARRNRCVGRGNNDVCITGNRNSDCVGSQDTCIMGPGQDGCHGGRGADQLYGGAGFDYCTASAAAASHTAAMLGHVASSARVGLREHHSVERSTKAVM